MKERRSILDLFKPIKKEQTYTYSRFKELNSYRSYFSKFGNNIYASDDVRACVRALSEHTSKANPRCTNKQIERLLALKPNQYMNGKDMLAKLRNILEIKNTAFLYIERDNLNHVIGFYPVPYETAEAMEYKNGLFVRFHFSGRAAKKLTIPWEDLAVLRKDYLMSDIANAVKSTANLRGILKSTKAMLAPEDIKKQKDTFVQDYMNLENGSGIASIDSSQEFIPIQMKPTTATAEEAKEYREKVYKYFGVNEKIIMSKYTESEYDAFYESRIEPFLVALSLELTRKIFTERELSFGAEVWFESNRLQYASAKTKISMVSLVDRGLMTPNEFRELFNMSPYDGGDEFILRLDTGKTGDTTDEPSANPVGRPKNEEGEEGEE